MGNVAHRGLSCVVVAVVSACGTAAEPVEQTPEKAKPLCETTGRFCRGDVLLTCAFDQPDPIERVVGIEPRLGGKTTDCTEAGMVCSETSLACAAPERSALALRCEDEYELRLLPLSRVAPRDTYACTPEVLPGDEVVLSLEGPSDGVAPYQMQLSVRGPHMKASRVLVFDVPPFDDGAECTALEVMDGDAFVFVSPHTTRYVVIDTVEKTSPEEEISVGKTCSRCGNRRVDDNEACDDGNLTDGDGCSSTCEREQGWYCRADEPRGQSRCTLNARCEDAAAVAPGTVSFSAISNYGANADFGRCAPNPIDRVEFQVVVPAHQTLTLEGRGETRITSACEDRSTCLGERSYANTDDQPRAVWVHASAASGHEGTLVIRLSP